MDNGASSYRRFLGGDDNGFVEIVRDYNDGLILYLNSFVNNISVADELAEDTFVKLGVKSRGTMAGHHSRPGFTLSGEMLRSIISEKPQGRITFLFTTLASDLLKSCLKTATYKRSGRSSFTGL